MDKEQVRRHLERLTGQQAPFREPEDSIQIFTETECGLGYSQLNELLLIFGFDRVSRSFFQYLVNGELDYKPGQAFSSESELTTGIDRFRQLAVLLYGNVKFAFKTLSRSYLELAAAIGSVAETSETSFALRHCPVLELRRIAPEDAYLTGYLVERRLNQQLDRDPQDEEAKAKLRRRKMILGEALANHRAYLASDHLDVYVATSMRERHEFVEVSKLVQRIFGHPVLENLRLRYFDPTQACCPNRIDKGLSEALMLKRAKCTIYLAQESDTLGKDSELASTLAQGKPVIAFIPSSTNLCVDDYCARLKTAYPEKSEADLMLGQLRVFEPGAAWDDEEVRSWCAAPEQADTARLRARLHDAMACHYERRAKTLRESHPLGIQVNLDTGVANGVLVVRTVDDCANLVRNIVLRRMELRLEDDAGYLLLKEAISDSCFRVVTNDRMLTNTFWNFYLDQAE